MLLQENIVEDSRKFVNHNFSNRGRFSVCQTGDGSLFVFVFLIDHLCFNMQHPSGEIHILCKDGPVDGTHFVIQVWRMPDLRRAARQLRWHLPLRSPGIRRRHSEGDWTPPEKASVSPTYRGGGHHLLGIFPAVRTTEFHFVDHHAVIHHLSAFGDDDFLHLETGIRSGQRQGLIPGDLCSGKLNGLAFKVDLFLIRVSIFGIPQIGVVLDNLSGLCVNVEFIFQLPREQEYDLIDLSSIPVEFGSKWIWSLQKGSPVFG